MNPTCIQPAEFKSFYSFEVLRMAIFQFFRLTEISAARRYVERYRRKEGWCVAELNDLTLFCAKHSEYHQTFPITALGSAQSIPGGLIAPVAYLGHVPRIVEVHFVLPKFMGYGVLAKLK